MTVLICEFVRFRPVSLILFTSMLLSWYFFSLNWPFQCFYNDIFKTFLTYIPSHDRLGSGLVSHWTIFLVNIRWLALGNTQSGTDWVYIRDAFAYDADDVHYYKVPHHSLLDMLIQAYTEGTAPRSWHYYLAWSLICWIFAWLVTFCLHRIMELCHGGEIWPICQGWYDPNISEYIAIHTTVWTMSHAFGKVVLNVFNLTHLSLSHAIF